MTAENPDNYVETHLPPAIIKRLESGAFQSLMVHLRERSDAVPNIDLMTVSGFCRNCLSKVSDLMNCHPQSRISIRIAKIAHCSPIPLSVACRGSSQAVR